MRAAAVQLNSTADRDRNLATADRLTRAAAAAGAELVVLPEKWPVLGTPEETAAGAEPLDGPALRWARATARELGIDLVAGSIAERVDGADRGSNTSVHFGPDGARWPSTARSTCSTSRSAGGPTASPRTRRPARRSSSRETADGVELGLSVCYDLRFPELYRILAVRGARVLVVPAAFTLATTREHWEVLLRARAIEDQAFVVAANQVGEHATGYRSGGRSMIVDPWGVVLAQAPDTETYVLAELDLERQAEIRRTLPSLANRARRPTAGRARCTPSGPTKPHRRQAPDHPRRRRARVRAPGLPHLPRVGHRRRGGRRLRARLPLLRLQGRGARHAVPGALGACSWRRSPRSTGATSPRATSCTPVASFIVDSYRHDPELMKVIIVEVTRAANSFGAAHLDTIREAYREIADIVAKAQASGAFRTT